MSEIQSIWEFITVQVFPHWPGLSFALFITILAQTLKTRVLTLDAAIKYPILAWLRRLFPILLLLLGIIPGVTWVGEVIPGIDTVGEKVWYFVGCSGVSILGFNTFRQWVKKKYDVQVGLASIIPVPPKLPEVKSDCGEDR